MALLPLVDCRVRLREVYADLQPRCHSNGFPYGVATVRTVRLLVKYTVREYAELTRRFGEMIGSSEIDCPEYRRDSSCADETILVGHLR